MQWSGGSALGLFQLFDRVFVLEELIGGDHGDAVPGADLVAEGAADAAGEIDGADLKEASWR